MVALLRRHVQQLLVAACAARVNGLGVPLPLLGCRILIVQMQRREMLFVGAHRFTFVLQITMRNLRLRIRLQVLEMMFGLN